MALEVLEPCAVKVASTVLRGSGDGDISALLDRSLRLLREGHERGVACVKVLIGKYMVTASPSLLPRILGCDPSSGHSLSLIQRGGQRSGCLVCKCRWKRYQDPQSAAPEGMNPLPGFAAPACAGGRTVAHGLGDLFLALPICKVYKPVTFAV